MVQLAASDYSFRVHLLPLVRALEQEGMDVICCGPPGPFARELTAQGLRYVPVPLHRSANPLRQALSIPRLAAALRRLNADVLHTHTAAAGLVGRLVARRAGIRAVVHTIHGLHNKSGSRRAALFFEWCECWGARRSDYVFVQNREDLERVRGWNAIPEERVRDIGNGIDLAHFEPSLRSAGDSRRLRDQLGIPAAATLVTFIGRPTSEKGAGDVLALASRPDLRAGGVFFLCVIPSVAGDGSSLSRKLHSASAELPLLALGFRDDVRNLLAASDIFLLPSRFEGLSKSMIEAMAMKLPVIASDVRGCRELVEEGSSGFLVEPGDLDRMAAYILRLVHDPETRRAMGRRGRAIAVDHFDTGRFTARQAEVIGRLAFAT